MTTSKPEEAFAFQLKAVGLLDEIAREHLFARDVGRRWRFDFAHLKLAIAVELEGGIGRYRDKPRDQNSGPLGNRMTTAEYRRLVSGGADLGPQRTAMTSRHASPDGFEEDSRKYATAMVMGWWVLRFTPRQVDTGEALQTLEAAIAIRERTCNWTLPVASRADGLPWFQNKETR